MFETVSFHLVKPCNMSCKFCYATFNDFKVNKILSFEDASEIVFKLHKAGMQKITFAGGEPMLYKHLDKLLKFSKGLGLTTSIITNGSMITKSWLKYIEPSLDWIGISIDTTSFETATKIGRITKREQFVNYYRLIDMIQRHDFKLKINTVVNIHNQNEDMKNFINYAKPSRWKIFNTLKVEGQNDKDFLEIKSTDFNGFVMNNIHPAMVVETNELMTGSYLLIDPLGRMFENTVGKHTYSDSLINNSVSHCLNQITLKRDVFEARGGIYAWK